MDFSRKPKIGMLFIGADRFRELGKDTADGSYEKRKEEEYKYFTSAVSEFADVITTGMTYTREQAEKTASEFIASKVDCIVVSFMSWAEDYPWISFLRSISPDIPLMLASVARDGIYITDTNDENQFIDFLSAGAIVGFLEASGSVKRFCRNKIQMQVGTLSEICEKIRVFSKAALARSILAKTTIGLLACYNEAMYSTYVDPYNVYSKLGARLKFLSVADLERKVSEVTQPETAGQIKRLCSLCKVHESVDMEKLAASVRATLAMEHLATENETDLLVLNDIDTTLFSHIGLRPGFSPLGTDYKTVTVPEGDIGGGLAVYILRILSGRTANFIEPFYINKTTNTFAAGHAGPNDYTEKMENVIIARDERFAKSKWKYAGAPFAWYVFPEGEKTMLHVSEENGKMKMVATVVECLPTKHYLASYSHADFRHKTIPCEELFRRIASAGVNQHFGIAPGNLLCELEMLATLMDFDFYNVSKMSPASVGGGGHFLNQRGIQSLTD